MGSPWVNACGVATAIACAIPPEGETSSQSTTHDGTSTSSSEVGPTGSGESESTSEGSGPVEDDCGNGLLEAGEVCDDGNEVDADGCNRDCRQSGQMVFELVFDTSALGPEQINDIDHASDGTYVLGGHVAGAGQDA